MGSVKIDTHKRERMYEQQFPLHTYDGVKAFYENITYIKSQRYKGDLDASVLLLDFEEIVATAPLTKREQEVMYYRFERELTQKETAKVLGLSIRAVATYTRRAIFKIADTFAVTEGYKHVQP